MTANHGTHVLVYGPSGVGKSTICRHPSIADSGWKVFDLDLVVASLPSVQMDAGSYFGKYGPAKFLERCNEAVAKILEAHSDERVIIVAGAGLLEAPGAIDLIRKFESTVLIEAPPDTAWRQDNGRKSSAHRRTFEQYSAVEFNGKRVTLYNEAKHRVASGCSTVNEEVAALLATIEPRIEML